DDPPHWESADASMDWPKQNEPPYPSTRITTTTTHPPGTTVKTRVRETTESLDTAAIDSEMYFLGLFNTPDPFADSKFVPHLRYPTFTEFVDHLKKRHVPEHVLEKVGAANLRKPTFAESRPEYLDRLFE